MSTYRVTKTGSTGKTGRAAALLPITALSRDSGSTIFRRSRSRSINTPGVALAHESLTGWLNGDDSWTEVAPEYRNSDESRERILDLLKLVRDVIAEFERLAPERYANFYALPPKPGWSGEQRLIVHFGAISRALGEYATVPYLAFQPSSRLWGLGHWPVGYAEPFGRTAPKPQRTFRPYGEVMAAHGILELARSEVLHRIKQCDCGRWFFMKRRDGVACSDRCRKRIHDRKPEVIERRKKQARKNGGYTSGKIHLEEYRTSLVGDTPQGRRHLPKSQRQVGKPNRRKGQ